jgi:hypothetical protein
VVLLDVDLDFRIVFLIQEHEPKKAEVLMTRSASDPQCRHVPTGIATAATATTSGIGKSALRLLTQLASRGPMAPTWPASSDQTDHAEILLRADLAVRFDDGRLAITEPGRAHLARVAFTGAGSAIDPFLGQHIGLAQAEVETPDGRAALALDPTESPLAWLARRKGRDGRALIEPIHLQAGERLRADVTLAQMLPRVTANWSSSVARGRRSDNGAMNFTEAAVAARQRVDQAFAALGPEFTGLLLDVCCFLKGLEDVERERHWPPRSAKVVLQLGLDRLARHYGFVAEARGKPRAQVRNWTAPEAACTAIE